MSNFLYLLFDVYECFVSMYICVCVCVVWGACITMSMTGTFEGQISTSDPLEVELQMVVNCHVDVGN